MVKIAPLKEERFGVFLCVGIDVHTLRCLRARHCGAASACWIHEIAVDGDIALRQLTAVGKYRPQRLLNERDAF